MAHIKTDQRVLVLPDVHAPLHNEAVLKIVSDFKKCWKPTKTLLLGDFIDAAAISSFAKEEGTASALHEFEVANELLDKFSKPNDVFFEGNHEERFRRPGAIPAELRSILDPKRWLRIKERKLKWVPYTTRKEGILKIGKLSFKHGSRTGVSAGKNEAIQHGHIVFGHTHWTQVTPVSALNETRVAYNVGCLCDIEKMNYAFRVGLPPWQNGWGYATIKKSGNFTMNVVRVLDNEVVIEGKTYRVS